MQAVKNNIFGIFLISLFAFAIYGLGVALVTTLYVLHTLFIPQSTPSNLIDSNSIEEACRIFQFDPYDEFCVNPSYQNENVLQAKLERKFPPGKATYMEVIPLLENKFRSNPLTGNLEPNCMWHNELSIRSCFFEFPPSIYITIDFNADKIAMGYHVAISSGNLR